MTKTIIIIAIVLIAAFLLLTSRNKKGESPLTNTKPEKITKPTNQINNDKLIIVKTVKLDLLKQAIKSSVTVIIKKALSHYLGLLFLMIFT